MSPDDAPLITDEAGTDPLLRCVHSPSREVRLVRRNRCQIYPKKGTPLTSHIAHPAPGLIDRATRVASLGSCFASNIRTWLLDHGYRYVQAEHGTAAEHTSLRVGLVYNPGTLAQIAERAIDAFHPAERLWRYDRSIMDPYRVFVGWPDEQAMAIELDRHAKACRLMLERAEVLIVTLGMSEVWRSIADGAIFAMAPPKGVLDEQAHRFEMLSVEESLAHLERFYAIARDINPRLQLITTLSPVPLRATYRNDAAVISDAASKARLRVAIDEFLTRHTEVKYFPSFEIIRQVMTDPYEADNIHVKYEVIQTMMDTFMRAFGDLESASAA
ncbi:MAG: GSCFA domain-containing protein [Planctomycetota bacterium]